MNPLLQAKGCCVRTLRLYYQTIECAIGNPETEQTHLEQMHFRNSYSAPHVNRPPSLLSRGWRGTSKGTVWINQIVS